MEKSGIQRLGLGDKRDGFFYVPTGFEEKDTLPLLVAFHGAGGGASQMIAALQESAERGNFLLLAPDSRSVTWDMIEGHAGPDLEFLNQALSLLFARFAVDPRHRGVSGFSDGASYALTVGLENGDEFSHVIAFSPGFQAASHVTNHPKIYISHGTRDRVLPVRLSQRMVPGLKGLGLDVNYHEFEGEHEMPPSIVKEALDWFLSPLGPLPISPAEIPSRGKGIEAT